MSLLCESNRLPDKSQRLKANIMQALKQIYDPEIPVNIYELGLIYSIDINEQGAVKVEMTLTAPACPVAGILPTQVETAIRGVEGVEQVSVELVWAPPWSQELMSDEARLSLGLM